MQTDELEYEAEPELRHEILEVRDPLFFQQENTPVGWFKHLALEKGNWQFTATHETDDLYKLTHPSGVEFRAELKEGRGADKGTYSVKGCVRDARSAASSFFDGVNLHGIGENGWKLRPAQLGAVHSILAHWSLSRDAATIVLPTGTGKTETMLVTTLVDRAPRTLVVVPTRDLKDQLAEKFMNWGMLRRLGVLPVTAPNPKVLILTKTITEGSMLEHINSADVVISTPALLARAPEEVKSGLRAAFSHVYFDEAHHVVAAEWDAIKKLFSASKVLQFTATPYRNDRKPIEGKLIYNYPLSKALEDNCFSPISLVAVDERHPRRKDRAIADAAMERLIEDREKGYTRHRMMVRAETQPEASKLFECYKEWFPSERIVLVHSGIGGRKAIVDQIKDGKYDIIVCVDMLKEGFDYPELKIAAVHGVHKSLAVLLQFIGRFTRTQEGLGDASFIVNYAEEKISLELEDLFQEGSGWEHVIKEIADAKKNEAESLLAFLQGCQPYSGFDSPDVNLNPKLVYPALSCVCFSCASVEWRKFSDAFDLNKYSLSQPYFNPDENVFYFTTQKREKVKWARIKEIRDQTWDLIAMHHDLEKRLLYIGYSDKNLDVDYLVEIISAVTPLPLKGDCVFRSFDAINRLCIVHAGIFKPANHLHRYSRLSGADVTTELEKWKTGGRCDKSDFVGVGFRDGFPVSVGASVKGKIWSPARVGDLKQWKEWCLAIGKMVTDETIDSNLILEDSAKKIHLKAYPDNVVVLAADWSEGLYDRIHKITLEIPGDGSILLAETTLKQAGLSRDRADLVLDIGGKSYHFSILLGGPKGHSIVGLEELKIEVVGFKATALSLTQFFQENPPTLFLLNGCTISGCIHTDYGDCDIQSIPDERIEGLSWDGVDFTLESHYKSSTRRDNSIQEFMMKRLVNSGAVVVFNDDNAGESADIVAIFVEDGMIRFELVHCKYSKTTSGARLSDLYEVCGQTVVSLRYKWKPEELIKHLERRNATGILRGKRFYHGSPASLENIKKALKCSDVSFKFAIAQPGVEAASLNADMKRLLSSIYSTVIEMTETKLHCYFS